METERLLLRPWLESDAGTLFKYASDPEVGPRAGWPPHKSVEESLDIIRNVFSAGGMWAVVWKETGEAIGCVGYLTASSSNLHIAEDECEVGYWIARPYWGKGICTEALQLVIDHCFNEKGFTTLLGDYFPSNPASGRVLEKCGFTDTGEETTCPNLEVGSDQPVRVMKLKKMNKVRITAIRQTVYPDLMAQYENPIEHTCDVKVGQQWISVDGKCPEGMCPSAWSSMREFVESLARGEGNFFDGWMKNPMSAMISCNDGFRPFSFYLEVL